MAESSQYHVSFTGDTSDLTKQLNAVISTLNNMEKTTQKSGDDMDAMFKRLASTAATAFAGFSVKEFVKSVVDARGQMQQLEVAFETMLGSKSKMQKLMDELTQTALVTPFEFDDVANGAKQLLAYGTAAEDVNQTIKTLGDVAAGVGAPIGDIVYLYGTLQTQGRMYTQDLNQFTGRGIPMIAELAKQFGVTEGEVKGLVEAGKVGFPEVQRVMESLTSEGGQFFNLMENQSKTISGQISNLQDNFSSILNEIGKQAEGLITDVIGGAASALEHYKEIGSILAALATTYGVTKAAAVAYNVVQKAAAGQGIIIGIQNQIKALVGLTAAQNAQTVAVEKGRLAQIKANMAANANPYILLATAIVGACAAIYQYVKANDVAGKTQSAFTEQSAEAEASAHALFNTLRECEEGSAEYNAALKELNDQYPDIIAAHTDSATGILNIAKAEEEVCKAIEKRVAMQLIADAKTQAAQDAIQTRMEAAQEIRDNFEMVAADIFEDSGLTEKAAAQKASEITGYFIRTLKENTANINLSGLDLTTDEGEKQAEKMMQQARQKTLDAVAQQFAAEGLGYNDAVRVLTEGLSAWDFQSLPFTIQTMFGNKKDMQDARDATDDWVNSYIEEQKIIQETQKALSEATAYEDRPANSANGATATTAAETDAISKLEEAKQRLLTAQTNYNKAKKEGNTEAQAAAKQEEAQANKDIKTLEKELTVRGQISDHVKFLQDQLKQTNVGSKEEKDLQNRITRLNNKIKEQSGGSSSKGSAKSSDLTEEQKLRAEQLKALRITEQARIDQMQEGAAKELAQIKLNYQRKLDEIRLQEQRLKNQAANEKASGKRATGDLTASESATIDNQQSDAYREYQANLQQAAKRLLNETQSYYDKRAKLIEDGEGKIAALQQLASQGDITQDDAKQRTEEINYQQTQSLDAMDLEQAQRDVDFRIWQDTLTTMALDTLQAALTEAQNQLAILESDSGLRDNTELIKLRGQVAAYKKEVENKKTSTSKSDKREIKEETKAYKQLASGIKKCGSQLSTLGEEIGGVGGETLTALGSITSFAGGMIDSMVQLATISSQEIQNVSTSVATAIRAVETASVILAIIEAVIQLGQAMASIFGDKGNDTTGLQEHYQRVAESLDTVIEKQEKVLENATTGEKLDSAVGKIEETANAQFEAMLEKARARGNQRSKNARSVKFRSKGTMNEWKDELAALTGRDASMFVDINALLSLSAEELAKIQTELPYFWASLDEEWTDAVNSGLEYLDKIEDSYDKANEIRLGFSKEDWTTSFSDGLTDGLDSVEDFAESMEEMIRQSIISGIVFDQETKDQLEKLYADMAKVSQTETMTEEQKAQKLKELGDEAQKLYEAKAQQAQELMDAAGLSTSDADREADTAGFSGMTQDTAEELNGRFTAIQGHTYLITQTVQNLLTGQSALANTIGAIAGMGTQAHIFQSRIAEATEKTLSLLQTINAKGLRITE